MGFETKYGVKIDPVGLSGGVAAAYEHKVRTHLSWIEGTTVGQLLLNSIGCMRATTPATS